MRVFMTGATGSIGWAVLAEMLQAGHAVTALTRSDASAKRVRAAGAVPFMGDMRERTDWIGLGAAADVFIPLADSWDDEMEALDGGMIDDLIAHGRARVVYTGGCWLYGATGDHVAMEGDPFTPQPCFEWSVRHGERLLASDLSAAVIHPAMVYHREGGVFERMIQAARAGAPIDIWGSAEKRWPLIHRDDLARAYRALAERREAVGHFNAAAEMGVRVREIAKAVAAHWRSAAGYVERPIADVMAELGDWVEGAGFDQQMGSRRLGPELGWRPRWTDFRRTDLFAEAPE